MAAAAGSENHGRVGDDLTAGGRRRKDETIAIEERPSVAGELTGPDPLILAQRPVAIGPEHLEVEEDCRPALRRPG